MGDGPVRVIACARARGCCVLYYSWLIDGLAGGCVMRAVFGNSW